MNSNSKAYKVHYKSKQFPEDMKSLSAFYVFSLPKHNASSTLNGIVGLQIHVSILVKLGIITAFTGGKSTVGYSIL
jgi:hypothetical protein